MKWSWGEIFRKENILALLDIVSGQCTQEFRHFQADALNTNRENVDKWIITSKPVFVGQIVEYYYHPKMADDNHENDESDKST